MADTIWRSRYHLRIPSLYCGEYVKWKFKNNNNKKKDNYDECF